MNEGVTSCKIVLKYNAIAGVDPMPRIREIVTTLSLQINEVAEECPIAGKRLKMIHISGEPNMLTELTRRLRRFPSVTAKFV